jgi:amino acid permease
MRYSCHQNIFAVYNELMDLTPKRIEKVIFMSVSSSFIVYQIIGIIGYLTFGNSVKSNIIAMYPHGAFVTGGQLAIAILVLLSYPLQCHPCRASLEKVLFATSYSSKRKYLLMTIGIMIFSYLIAISVSNLSTVLSFVGATGSTTICYILPGLFYYKFRDNTDLVERWDFMKIGAMALAATGVLVMSTSLTSQILGNASSH